MLIFNGSLPDSNLLATVTLWPNIQYRGIFTPTTPASTDPVWIPILICETKYYLIFHYNPTTFIRSSLYLDGFSFMSMMTATGLDHLQRHPSDLQRVRWTILMQATSNAISIADCFHLKANKNSQLLSNFTPFAHKLLTSCSPEIPTP